MPKWTPEEARAHARRGGEANRLRWQRIRDATADGGSGPLRSAKPTPDPVTRRRLASLREHLQVLREQQQVVGERILAERHPEKLPTWAKVQGMLLDQELKLLRAQGTPAPVTLPPTQGLRVAVPSVPPVAVVARSPPGHPPSGGNGAGGQSGCQGVRLNCPNEPQEERSEPFDENGEIVGREM